MSPALFALPQMIPDETLVGAALGAELGRFAMLRLPKREIVPDLVHLPDRGGEDDPALPDEAAAAIAHRPALDEAGRLESALVAPDGAFIRPDLLSDVALALVADGLPIRVRPVARSGMAGMGSERAKRPPPDIQDGPRRLDQNEKAVALKPLGQGGKCARRVVSAFGRACMVLIHCFFLTVGPQGGRQATPVRTGAFLLAQPGKRD